MYGHWTVKPQVAYGNAFLGDKLLKVPGVFQTHVHQHQPLQRCLEAMASRPSSPGNEVEAGGNLPAKGFAGKTIGEGELHQRFQKNCVPILVDVSQEATQFWHQAISTSVIDA